MTRIANRTALLLALIAPLALSACASSEAPKAAAPVAKVEAPKVDPDQALASSVKAALDQQPSLKPLNLKVTSKKGDITIDGVMTDDQQMVLAGTIAQDIEGVKNITNNMIAK